MPIGSISAAVALAAWLAASPAAARQEGPVVGGSASPSAGGTQDPFALDLDALGSDALHEAEGAAVSPLSQEELESHVHDAAGRAGFLGWSQHTWAIALGINTATLLLLAAATRWIKIKGKGLQLLRAHKILAYCTMASAAVHAMVVLLD